MVFDFWSHFVCVSSIVIVAQSGQSFVLALREYRVLSVFTKTAAVSFKNKMLCASKARGEGGRLVQGQT